MSYSLADGSIKIGEIPRRNSGIREGKFLQAMRLQTPESDPNFPTYFTPERFFIGKLSEVKFYDSCKCILSMLFCHLDIRIPSIRVCVHKYILIHWWSCLLLRYKYSYNWIISPSNSLIFLQPNTQESPVSCTSYITTRMILSTDVGEELLWIAKTSAAEIQPNKFFIVWIP